MERPVEGRGVGDALQNLAGLLPNITLPSFDMFKKILIVVIVIVVLVIIGFLMWYFKT